MNLKILFALIFIGLLVTPAFAANKVDLYFFEIPGCPHCANVEAWFNTIKSDYPTLNIVKINAAQNQEQFKQFLTDYNVPSNEWGSVPRIFIGNYTCLGDTPCISTLKEHIEYCRDNQCTIPTNQTPKQELEIGKLVATFAATDAFSPCALAVLTLLLAVIMLKNPDHKRKVLFAGLAFSLGIFLIYFSIGMLIVFGFKSVLSVSNFDKSIFHTIFALFAIFIGLINLKDFIWDTKTHEVPTSWRPKMNDLIKKTASVPGAFLVGLLVAFFLTPCTVGPYFVAGSILSDFNWTLSLPLLLLYNVIFILPMVILTFIIYSGKTSIEKATEWRQNKKKYLHLLSALVLIGLGTAMLIGLV